MDPMDSHSARAALDQADEARNQGARAATRPWWYYPALGASVLLAFASVSAGGSVVTVGVPFGLGIFPLALSMLANSATGAAPDRSYAEPSLRRLSWILAAVLAVLAVAGLVLELAADLRWSMAVCGVPALVAVVVTGRALDRMRSERFRRN